jgi:hypothetical protein
MDTGKPEEVEKYISYFLDNLPQRETVDVFLVLIGERPACLVMDPDTEEKQKLRDFCEVFDLNYLLKEREDGSMLSDSGFFISCKQDRFEMLEDSDGRFYGFSDRCVGEFLGFPEDDIEFFQENVKKGHVEAETRKVVEDLLSRGVIDEGEARLMELTTYVPRPKKENVERAVDKGRVYRDALLDFDRGNNTSIGKKTLEEFFGHALGD